MSRVQQRKYNKDKLPLNCCLASDILLGCICRSQSYFKELELPVCYNEPPPNYSIFYLFHVKQISTGLEHSASDQIFVLIQCLISKTSTYFLLEPVFLSLTSFLCGCHSHSSLLPALSSSVYSLILTFFFPRLSFLCLSLSSSTRLP